MPSKLPLPRGWKRRVCSSVMHTWLLGPTACPHLLEPPVTVHSRASTCSIRRSALHSSSVQSRWPTSPFSRALPPEASSSLRSDSPAPPGAGCPSTCRTRRTPPAPRGERTPGRTRGRAPTSGAWPSPRSNLHRHYAGRTRSDSCSVGPAKQSERPTRSAGRRAQGLPPAPAPRTEGARSWCRRSPTSGSPHPDCPE